MMYGYVSFSDGSEEIASLAYLPSQMHNLRTIIREILDSGHEAVVPARFFGVSAYYHGELAYRCQILDANEEEVTAGNSITSDLGKAMVLWAGTEHPDNTKWDVANRLNWNLYWSK